MTTNTIITTIKTVTWLLPAQSNGRRMLRYRPSDSGASCKEADVLARSAVVLVAHLCDGRPSVFTRHELFVDPVLFGKIDHGMHGVCLAFIHGGSPGHHVATALSDRIDEALTVRLYALRCARK